MQIVGALLALAGFLAAQADLVDQRTYKYLLPNAVGSVLLTIVAAFTSQWGFVILQGVCALAAFYGIIRWRAPPSN